MKNDIFHGLMEKTKFTGDIEKKWMDSGRIPSFFLYSAFILTAFSTGYWYMVLEPALMRKAAVTARALAASQSAPIADALEGFTPGSTGIEAAKKRAENAMNRLLLLRDPETGAMFIQGVEVETDPDILPVNRLQKGRLSPFPLLVTEIPLYSTDTRELLGIARIHNHRDFYRHFKKEIFVTFLIGTGTMIILLLSAWRVSLGLIGKIRTANEKLRQKQAQVVQAGRLSALGEMATGIAHEINQPLAIIRMAAEGINEYFLKNDEKSMEARAARKIEDQVRRAAEIIEHMQNFVRGGRSGVSEAVDLSAPVSKALSFFREQFRIHGIRLSVHMPETKTMAEVNSGRFEQVVVNLLSNARHAVEQKAALNDPSYEKNIVVSLFSQEESKTAVLEISDNGIGMTPDVKERCMEPFYTTRDIGEGMGLGLSIVHGIIKEFRMDLRIESAPDKGCLFRITARTAEKKGPACKPIEKRGD